MNHQGGIRAREIDAGKFLPCCSTARTDLVIDTDRYGDRRVVRLPESRTVGQRNGLSAGPDVKLPEKVPEMEFHGVFTDAKVRWQLTVPLAGGQQLKDLKFPGSQPPLSYVPRGS